MPLQLGLGIQMHQYFQSRFIIDPLKKHGFCVLDSKVLKYEYCAAVHQVTKIPGLPESSSAEPTHCMHHVENANHNSWALVGHNTFHGMGIICYVTPVVSSSFPILRLEDVSISIVLDLLRSENFTIKQDTFEAYI